LDADCESALLLQGRNLEQDGLPVNEALSLGVHESQSLLWERMVALSQPFAHYLLPKLQQHFPELAEKLTPETLYGAINVIREPSMIRVEADEVTYPLHIILR
jgi:carboxypeptidase Taq